MLQILHKYFANITQIFEKYLIYMYIWSNLSGMRKIATQS